MGATFKPTGAYSNLSRLELEALRKADGAAAGKAITVGDSGLLPEGVVGPGNVNAERFLTGPQLAIEDVYGVRPPALPGTLLGSTTQPAPVFSETVQWYGPQALVDDVRGRRVTASNWGTNDPTVDYVAAGVQPGDLVIVQQQPLVGPSGSLNTYGTAVVQSVVSPSQLACVSINNPANGTPTQWGADGKEYSYLIIRPAAVQLFAVPGSGPRGSEQTFLAVVPGATVHGLLSPTTAQIEAERVKDLVGPGYATDPTADRADAVYDFPAPRSAASKLGYRVVLYPDDGTGTGPDLTKPIAAQNPLVSPFIPSNDQRMTVDYRAGVIRFSCAPETGSTVKPSSGCVHPTTGRLNLYAVFWAVDLTLTSGVAKGLWATRGLPGLPRAPGRMRFSTTGNRPWWLLGTTGSGNELFVDAVDAQEDYRKPTRFGVLDSTDAQTPKRYFSYAAGETSVYRRLWRMISQGGLAADPTTANETEVADRLAVSVGDSSGPPTAPGLINSTVLVGTDDGARWADSALTQASYKVDEGQFTTLHLRRGTHRFQNAFHVPPGVIVEGEGDGTVVRSKEGTVFRFGPNTTRGVWEGFHASIDLPSALRVEGVDIQWNPVRRVWGFVYADVSTGALWFNERDQEGNMRFPGMGVDIKATATNFFTTASPNSQDHTTGHYPRLAHCLSTNEYFVTWVQEKTVGPNTGPAVYFQVFRVVEPDDATETNPQEQKPVLTVTKFYASPQALASGFTWTNHPSIAVGQDAAFNVPFVVSCWGYFDVNPSLYTTSAVRVYMRAFFGAPLVDFVGSDFISNAAVVSSTDVTLDGYAEGVQTVWSVRKHSLIMGTQGEWTITAGAAPDPGHSYLTDAGVGNFLTKGVGAGSRFMYLGIPLSPNYVTGYLNDAPSIYGGLNLLSIPSYGDDGIVYGFDSSNPARPQIKTGRDGQPFTTYSAHLLVTSSTGATTTGGNVLNDATPNFLTAGVSVGDRMIIVSGPNAGEYKIIGSIGAHSFTVSPLFPGNDPTTDYVVLIGRPFRFAMVPQTYVEGRRSLDFFGTEQPKTLLAGGTIPGTATSYEFGEYEPDFVRVAAAEDRFLVVYQNMHTTSRLSKDYMLGEMGLNWSPAPADGFIFLREYTAPYREHISTAAVLLDRNGNPADEVRDAISVDMPEFDEAKGRPMTQLRRSLGTRTLIGSSPNFKDIVGTRKDAQQMADEVACLNWHHRWTTAQSPSLLPDVTWNGEDFVIASPSKHETRSFTGNYVTDAGGDVTFSDATVYFGTETSYGQTENQGVGRGTLSPGDLIYFPATNTATTVDTVLAPHMVTLTANDSALLQTGPSATTTNVEWVWVRGGGAQHGVKHPGFRIDLNGRVKASASYITFSEEKADDASLNFLGSPQTTLMSRTGGSDRFIDGAWVTSGVNFPATLNYDAPGDARWKADIGFRGPAVGVSKGTSYLASGETSLVALSWGETCYGSVDREVAGGDGSPNTASNTIYVSKQSFGPYNNGLRNMRLEGNTGAQVYSLIHPLRVKSQNLVWTRHGSPTASQGFFATDGYRSCFVFAGRRTGYDDLPLSTFSGVNAFENFAHGVYAVYTDAVGLDPVRVEGPRSKIQTDYPAPWLFQDAPFAQEFYSQIVAGVGREVYPNLAAAPRVVWDGESFAAAWWETATQSNETPTLRFCFFPGADQPMGPAAGNPYRASGAVAAVQEVQMDVGTGYKVGVVEMATSGRTYAAAWTLGLDREVAGTSSTGAMVGVTIFSPSVSGTGHLYDCEAAPYYGTTTGTALPGYLGQAQDQDHKYGTMTTTGSVDFSGMAEVGDIVVVTTGTAMGRYRIVSITGATLFLDRWIPSTTFSFTLHKPKNPPGAKSYVLDIHPAIGPQRTGLGQPQIVWDGQRYVVAWRSAGYSESGIKADHLMVAQLREDGVGSPSYTTVSHTRQSLLADQPIMLVSPNDVLPNKVYFAGRSLGTFTSNVTTAGSSINAPGGTNWLTEGVALGSLVLFGPVGNKRMYVVRQVTASTITTNTALHVVGAQPMEVYAHRPMPRVKLGDTLHLSQAYYDTTVTAVPALLRVQAVYPDIHAMLIEDGLPSTSGIDKIGLIGYLDNAGKGDPNTTADTNPVVDDGLVPSPVLNQQLGRTSAILARIGRIYGLAFMPEVEKYVALVGNDSTGNSNGIGLVTFDRRNLQADREVAVSSATTHLVSGMAFNGQHILVVWATDNATPALTELWYALYDTQLRAVGAPQALRSHGDFHSLSPGNTPGDGVLSLLFQDAAPRIRNVQVRWNDRLCRWMVSVSVTTYVDLAPTQGNGTHQLPPERRMDTVSVTGFTANKLTLNHGGTNQTDWITPGCTLVFRYDANASGGSAIPELYAQVLDVNWSSGPNQATVTLSTAYFPRLPTDYVTGDIFVAPREDVFLLTLGYPDPTIEMVDPDKVFLEGITFSGGADVEERWKYLGRTRWMASGPLVGATLKRKLLAKAIGAIPGDTASAMQRPQWMPVQDRPTPPVFRDIKTRARNNHRDTKGKK